MHRDVWIHSHRQNITEEKKIHPEASLIIPFEEELGRKITLTNQNPVPGSQSHDLCKDQ